MPRATELTRAGKLIEATELIQFLMQGQTKAQDATLDQDVTEGDFVALDDDQATKPQAKAKPATGTRDMLRGLKTGGLAGHNVRHSAEPDLPDNGAAVAAQFAPKGLDEQHTKSGSNAGRSYDRTSHEDDNGRSMVEHWKIDNAGHAWAGGQSGGSYTDPTGRIARNAVIFPAA
ncbi:MAG: hypothetical protein II336_15860 [Loktanella sp.]|nr:hypothetical protein [Loktanella sp.]